MIFHQYKGLSNEWVPKPAVDEMMVTSTCTKESKYGKLVLDEIMEFVRDASSDADAIHNLNVILKEYLKEYDKRKTPWQRIKGLFL